VDMEEEKWCIGKQELSIDPGRIYETGGISLHIFLRKNIVEEMMRKEDELCEPLEGEARYNGYERPTLVQED
jgi:hypothetical protein